ncbi:hypothetical protein [Flavobacterium sp.]|jgi:hypothetical protein|uniref:hypothetical protein n=1 Tax=Flavobacterium sp. TaxID=239 RepID=UPI0037BF6D25
MKKTYILLTLLVSTLSFSNSIEEKKKSEVIDDCYAVYKATKDAAIEQGFSDTAAQAIGAAAYNTCKGKTRTLQNSN